MRRYAIPAPVRASEAVRPERRIEWQVIDLADCGALMTAPMRPHQVSKCGECWAGTRRECIPDETEIRAPTRPRSGAKEQWNPAGGLL